MSNDIWMPIICVVFGIMIVSYAVRKLRHTNPISVWTLGYIYLILSGGILAGLCGAIILIYVI